MKSMGLLKTTLVDFPGEVAAVLFTHGCNMRCSYCHNPLLIQGSPPPEFLSWEEILQFLEHRRSVLGGVVITGGEPLLHLDLQDKIKAIRELGLRIKVDTNGSKPQSLKSLKGVDYWAMDFKGTDAHYEKWAPGLFSKVLDSLDYLKTLNPLDFELRWTYLHTIHQKEDARIMAQHLLPGTRLFLTAFQSGITLDPRLGTDFEPSIQELEEARKVFLDAGVLAEIR